MLKRASRGWARVELALAAALAVAVTLMILANVVTRAAGQAIYWTDEAAIYAMIWMTFLAASASIHDRSAVAVTLVPDMLGAGGRRLFRVAVDVIVLAFALFMAWFCWRWFRPDVLIATGFDTQAFQQETFNFIYAEPTTTLGIPKVWVWLVMPLFTLGLILHALYNLIAGLRGEDPDPVSAA